MGLLNRLYETFGGGKTIEMWRRLALLYRRQLDQQQAECIRLVRENSILKCRVKELEAGFLVEDNETIMEFTHVNFG